MNKNLLIVLSIFLLALPSVSAFCFFGIGDNCNEDIIIITRGSNEDVNYTWLDTMEFAFEEPAKNVDIEIIGAELVISSSSSISSGSPINIGTGISKLKLEVLSGADPVGDININAVKHDRDTGVTTEPYSESLALNGVGDTNMTAQWIGNKTATNDINLTTTNFDGALELTQWSFYQDAEEDFNVIRVSVTIETADTAAAKSFDFNFFKVAGDGNVTNLIGFNDIDFAPNGISRDRIYRLDRNCLVDACFIDVSQDGIHAAFDQQNITTVEIVITYEFTRSLQVSGVAGNNVTRLIAGSNITLSPTNGIGDVTISSSGGGTDYGDVNVFSILQAQVPWQDVNVSNTLTVDWNGLQNYPAPCPSGQVVQGIGDTLTCVAAGSGGGNSFSLFFTNADLNGNGVLNITHALDTGNVGVHIYDDLNFEVVPDQVFVMDSNNVDVTISSFQPIPNTWNAVVLNTGGSGGGSTDSNAVGVTQTFVNADLSSGVLTVTHALGKQYPQFQIVDNNNAPIFPDDLNFLTSNTLNFDVSSFTPIDGTWRIVLDASH